MTNYERIKAMTVEEMADLLAYGHICDHIKGEQYGMCLDTYCTNCIKKWLESEV